MPLPLDPPDEVIHRRDCPQHESKPWDRFARCRCRDLAEQDRLDKADARNKGEL